MKTLLRILASLVTLAGTFYFVYWLPFSLLPVDRSSWVPAVVSLLCASGAAYFVWRHTGLMRSEQPSASLLSSVLFGAVLVGAIGFAAGFFGPIILAPESNQGPLLGIFFTGPAGALLGAVGGAIHWSGRSSVR